MINNGDITMLLVENEHVFKRVLEYIQTLDGRVKELEAQIFMLKELAEVEKNENE